MKPERKREVLELVRRSPVEKKQTLGELGLAASTYYRWQRRYREEGEAGLVDRRPQPGTVWNRMKPEEEKAILGAALREPDRSSREVACWLSDHAGFAVSESSVYRVLKRHGLIRGSERGGFSRRERISREAHTSERAVAEVMRAIFSWWAGAGIT